MPRAQRTTKSVARRIDLHYFQRPHPLRTLRFALSLLAILAALLWLAGYGLTRNNFVYTAGRLSPAHAVLSQKCYSCHVARTASFRESALDQSCLNCHDGPVHHSTQTFTPKCSSCHVEHRGQWRLASTTDPNCTQCHANLQTAGVATTFDRHITEFESGHPEFAALRPGFTDPGTIKLNHAVHMKAGLKGPHGELLQLACEDCHRPDETNQAWPYTIAPGSPAGETPKNANDLVLPAATSRMRPPSMLFSRAYMGPIVYARQCAGCHPLPYDKRFSESVPHDTPVAVHAYLVKKFQDYIAAHPAELREPVSTIALPARPIPVSPRVYSPPQQWVNAKVAEAEELLWGKTCKECHTLIPNGSGLPKVAESRITSRWFQHAVFDHNQHRLVNCESCHTTARTSQNTSDVLLPSIHICVECHHAGKTGAESRCFECHIYHDWKNEKDAKNHFTIAGLAPGAKLDMPRQDWPSTNEK